MYRITDISRNKMHLRKYILQIILGLFLLKDQGCLAKEKTTCSELILNLQIKMGEK